MSRLHVRYPALAFALSVVSAPISAQTVPVLVNQGVYTQNFNSMGTLVSVYPTGWNGYKISGSGALPDGAFINAATTPAFTANNGSDNTGSVYNFGTIGDTDRALGSVASPNTTPGFGVVLINNSGRTLTAADLLVAFRAEQWGTGASNNADETWAFEYRTGGPLLDVNDPSSVGWTQVTGLDFHEIQTGTNGSGPIDGNAVGNFTNVSGTLNGLIWNPGDRLVLRWLDSFDSGTNAGMGIDDFSFTVFAQVPEPGTLLLGSILLAGFAAGRWRLHSARAVRRP